jgi:hypothetical protein
LMTSTDGKVDRKDSWSDCFSKVCHTVSFSINRLEAKLDRKLKCVSSAIISIPDYFFLDKAIIEAS